jgi:hypothetical protein
MGQMRKTQSEQMFSDLSGTSSAGLRFMKVRDAFHSKSTIMRILKRHCAKTEVRTLSKHKNDFLKQRKASCRANSVKLFTQRPASICSRKPRKSHEYQPTLLPRLQLRWPQKSSLLEASIPTIIGHLLEREDVAEGLKLLQPAFERSLQPVVELFAMMDLRPFV